MKSNFMMVNLRCRFWSWSLWWTVLVTSPCLVLADAKPVSFQREIVPLLQKSCWGCHRPGKEKGGIDLTSYGALVKGGKHGPGLQAGRPDQSRLMEEISGPEPSMPKEGERLSAQEVALIERWIQEGAPDDTPVPTGKARSMPVYRAAPIISSIAYSPVGPCLAVAGRGEVLLFNATNYLPTARLVGDAGRIESIRFSPDGRRLAVAGGQPGQWGEIQIWDVAAGSQLHAYRSTFDSVYGADWSPDQTRIVFGAADRTSRVIEAETGHEVLKFDQHTDWVFGAAFLRDGLRFVSGSRDKSLKLVDISSGKLLETINRESETIRCLVRHPIEDWVLIGTDVRPRLYKAEVKKEHSDPNDDSNQLREFEHFEGGITALAFSPDGKWMASSGSPAGEVRVYDAVSTSRKATLRNHRGVVFSLAFSADGSQLATAGFEGIVRVFDWAGERLVTNFVPVEISAAESMAQARKRIPLPSDP